jgi:hypothetical protein
MGDDDVVVAQALADVATITILQNRTPWRLATSTSSSSRRCRAVS